MIDGTEICISLEGRRLAKETKGYKLGSNAHFDNSALSPALEAELQIMRSIAETQGARAKQRAGRS